MDDKKDREEELRKVEREVSTHKKLSHKNIVKLHWSYFVS